MPEKMCVVEIAATGVLLSNGEEMSLEQAIAAAKIYSENWPGRRVNILQGGGREVVQAWEDGQRQ